MCTNIFRSWTIRCSDSKFCHILSWVILEVQLFEVESFSKLDLLNFRRSKLVCSKSFSRTKLGILSSVGDSSLNWAAQSLGGKRSKFCYDHRISEIRFSYRDSQPRPPLRPEAVLAEEDDDEENSLLVVGPPSPPPAVTAGPPAPPPFLPSPPAPPPISVVRPPRPSTALPPSPPPVTEPSPIFTR